MRPGNFPTIGWRNWLCWCRISAFVSKIKEASSVNEIKDWLDTTANDYWHYHYRFDETSAFKRKNWAKQC
jgi:hypothetical protein